MIIGYKTPLPVTIYFSESTLETPWQKTAWCLDGVMTAKTQDCFDEERPENTSTVYTSVGTRFRIVRWNGLHVRLERSSCQAYYDNLSSPTPKIFVICQADPEGKPRPFLVTFDLTEAEACMEAGEQVYSCPLVPDLYLLLEKYVVENYIPTIPAKRQRIP